MEFKGQVIEVIDKSGTSKSTGNQFKAAQVVVQDSVNAKYPQIGVFDLFGEKVNYPNPGDNVNVTFNLKGSEYDGKWYGRLNAWKVEILAANTQHKAQQEVATTDPLADAPGQPDEASDDLPFSSGSR